MAAIELHSWFTTRRDCTVPAVPGQPALKITGLGFTYPGGEAPALEDISMQVQPGEKVALVGPNGAGKSTLIKLIAGLERQRTGDIHIYGNPVGACHHRVGYVPQRSSVDWRFPVTVRQVVMMGRYVHLGWLKRPAAIDRRQVEEAMAIMGLSEVADNQIGDLSGGQQQRVMLARTLAHNADLLLLDEPLNSLDVLTQELIFDVLEKAVESGRTVIVSIHDLGVLPLHFTRAVFLDKHIVADGPVAEVVTPHTILKAYGAHIHPHNGVWDADTPD
jgi:ABC-type Mn2+/Zn2+ transport system ATPase subunit